MFVCTHTADQATWRGETPSLMPHNLRGVWALSQATIGEKQLFRIHQAYLYNALLKFARVVPHQTDREQILVSAKHPTDVPEH